MKRIRIFNHETDEIHEQINYISFVPFVVKSCLRVVRDPTRKTRPF
jgi:hypothetical protein